mgnify:CR=1
EFVDEFNICVNVFVTDTTSAIIVDILLFFKSGSGSRAKLENSSTRYPI